MALTVQKVCDSSERPAKIEFDWECDRSVSMSTVHLRALRVLRRRGRSESFPGFLIAAGGIRTRMHRILNSAALPICLRPRMTGVGVEPTPSAF